MVFLASNNPATATMNFTDSQAKVLSMVVIGVGSFLVGLFPACITNRGGDRKLLLSSLLCFGAGVLFATSLLHMLPETRETLPLYAELIFCGGFLLLYMVDEIVHFVWGNVIDLPPEQHSHRMGISQTHQLTNNLPNNNVSVSHGYGHSHAGAGNSSKQHHIHNDLQTAHEAVPSCIAKDSNGVVLDQSGFEPNLVSNIARIRAGGHSSYGSIIEAQPLVPNEPAPCCEEEGTLLCHGSHTEPCANASAGLAGLLIALTLHATLEGLAVGLQTETDKVLLLVAAIASHKFVVGFCLGMELATATNSFLRHAIAIAVFAGGSSAGIGIGMLVTQIEDNWVSKILMPVLQGIAGGSLLYVTVSEVLPRERARWHRTTRRIAGITQFLSVTCGFFFMFILSKYAVC